jgi:hypothetical protein
MMHGKHHLARGFLDTEFGNNLGIAVSDVEQRYEHSAEVMVPLASDFSWFSI